MSSDTIDISIPVTGDMLVYPGDPTPRFGLAPGEPGDYWSVGVFEGGLHLGAHVDAPQHRIPGGKSVDELGLEPFLGPCFVADLGHVGGEVRATDLEALQVPASVERLLLKTRNSRTEYWREPWKGDAAGLDPGAAAWCVARRLKLVGIDYLSIEPLGEGAVHQELLAHEVAILEGLLLRDVAAGWYELTAAPVKLIGTDGAWCRALIRPMG